MDINMDSVRKRGHDDLSSISEGNEKRFTHKKRCIQGKSQDGNNLTQLLSSEPELSDIGALHAKSKTATQDESEPEAVFEEWRFVLYGNRGNQGVDEAFVSSSEGSVEAGGHQRILEEPKASSNEQIDPQVGQTWEELRRPRYAHHAKVIKQMNTHIKRMNGSIMSVGDMEYFLRMTKVLDELYKKTTSRNPTSPSNRQFPQTRKEVLELICGDEENENPWRVTGETNVPGDGAVWRVWDYASQSQIRDKDKGFFAKRSTPKGELSNWGGRHKSIELHASWKNRQPTPFISCGSRLKDMYDFRILHSKDRCAIHAPAKGTWLTLMNLNVRVRGGWPILNALKEMSHYKAMLDASIDRYEHEWLLPWQVRPKEIVWSFREKDIDNWMRKNKADWEEWRKAIADPVFAKHEEMSKAGAGQAEITKALLEILQVSMPMAEPYFK